MANTFTQIHLQIVFAVKYRDALINKNWKERLHQYMTGIIQTNKHKMLQINTMPDHLHMLIGFRTHQSLASLMQNVKVESCKWIKAERLAPSFAWQEGYGAFSYSSSHVADVIKYIQNQETHHARYNFWMSTGSCSKLSISITKNSIFSNNCNNKPPLFVPLHCIIFTTCGVHTTTWLIKTK